MNQTSVVTVPIGKTRRLDLARGAFLVRGFLYNDRDLRRDLDIHRHVDPKILRLQFAVAKEDLLDATDS